MKVEHNRRYFNKEAEKWDENTYHDPQKIRFLLEKMHFHSNDNILDVGTGTGVLIPYLLELTNHKGHLTVIDLAEQMINKAKEKYGGYPIRFIVGDITDYPLPEKSFDKIICYSVFPHFVAPATTFMTLASLLKENGLLQVAHSEGRKNIDARHRELGKSLISRGLPPSEKMAVLFETAGLQVLDLADRDDCYFVLGQRAPSFNPAVL